MLPQPERHDADVDQDTDADLADFAALQRLVVGP